MNDHPQTFNEAAVTVAQLLDGAYHVARPRLTVTTERLANSHEKHASKHEWTLFYVNVRACAETLMMPITAEAWVDTLIAKHMDYGPTNILKFGHDGLVVRTWDKVARIQNLMDHWAQLTTPANEPLVDSFNDLAGYCMIGVMLDRGWFELPLKKVPLANANGATVMT